MKLGNFNLLSIFCKMFRACLNLKDSLLNVLIMTEDSFTFIRLCAVCLFIYNRRITET